MKFDDGVKNVYNNTNKYKYVGNFQEWGVKKGE